MGGGYVVDKYVLLGLYAGILFISAVINTFDIDKVRWVVVASGWVQTLVPLAVAVLVPTLQKDRAPTSFVFATYNRDLGGINNTGITSDFYLFLIGLLASQYTFTGYDASAHMTEETANAETGNPIHSCVNKNIRFWGAPSSNAYAVKLRGGVRTAV